MASRKKRRNLWPFDAFKKTTVYHLRGRQRGVKESSTSRYKGYAVYKRADGGYSVPSLDRESVFDDKREAKRFIDAMRKHANPKRRRNALSWIVYPSQGSPKSFGFLSSAKKWAKAKANESGVSSVIYPSGGKGKTHHVAPDKRRKNPTLSLPKNKFVQAKVRMKGGKLQVLVDESLLGHAGVSGHVSLNRKTKKNPDRYEYEIKYRGKGIIGTVEAPTSREAKEIARSRWGGDPSKYGTGRIIYLDGSGKRLRAKRRPGDIGMRGF